MDNVERKVIELEADLRNTKERFKDEQTKTEQRLFNVEKDITEIKLVQERIDGKVDHIALTSEETRTDIKKGKNWLIATMVTCIIVPVLLSLILNLLT